MTGGTPQGSPLSPSIYDLHVSNGQEGGKSRLGAASSQADGTTENPPATDPSRVIDDCNSVVHGCVKDIDRALCQAAQELKSKWDRSKDRKNGVHLGVTLDKNGTRSLGRERRTQRSS